MTPSLRMLALVAGLIVAGAVTADAQKVLPPKTTGVDLAPHRAVYDLKLSRSRGAGSVEGVRGRIVYDFSGNACAGYELKFRQVSELDSGSGKAMLSDLRASTWEDVQAKKFRFNSENRINEKAVDTVDGNAERKSDAVAVTLKKPSGKSFKIGSGAVFPIEHMRKIIEAAREGKSVLEVVVYDGSETGEKLYDTLTVIGQPIKPGERPADDISGKTAGMANQTRWPVTISYFDRAAKGSPKGETMPAYSVGFELYENGVSRALKLDYNDFAISGEMTAIEMTPVKACP